MIDILLLLVILALIIHLPNLEGNYLEQDNTIYLRGICAIFVVLHHISQYINTGNFSNYLIFMGRYAVGVFFFLSGYALLTQLNKSKNYLKNFFVKRVLSLVIPYLIFSIIYYTSYKLRVDLNYSIFEIAKNFPKYDVVVANGWFMISIIVAYLSFYCSFRLIKNKDIALITTIILFGLYNYLMFKEGYKIHWYDAILTFPLGLVWARFKSQIDNILYRYSKFIILLGLINLFIWHNHAIWIDKLGITRDIIKVGIMNITVCSFVVFVMLLLVKLNIKNPIFKWIGKYSLELYLIHGLFIQLFKPKYSSHLTDFIFGIKVISFSIVCAVILSYLVKFITKKILHPFFT